MTRKRYIKLLMSLGVDRNLAATMAERERKDKIPYAESWEHINDHTPVPAFADIDEMHEMDGTAVAAAIEAGACVKPGPVIVAPGISGIDWSGFSWPPQPQPVAGFLCAKDESGAVKVTHQGLAKDRQDIDALDALVYAIESMVNRQMEAYV